MGPLGGGQVWIAGAEETAEIGDIGVIETLIAIVITALITGVDFVEEEAIDAAVDLNFADADQILLVERRS